MEASSWCWHQERVARFAAAPDIDVTTAASHAGCAQDKPPSQNYKLLLSYRIVKHKKIRQPDQLEQNILDA